MKVNLNMILTWRNLAKLSITALIVAAFSACGGGGGGGSSSVLYYPYETVYGDICRTYEATPGCTFDQKTGQRITVSYDPHYDRYGYKSDDLWFVEFDSSGMGAVYDDLGRLKYYSDVSKFAGWVGGNYIGVGTTGLFWEDIRNGTYTNSKK